MRWILSRRFSLRTALIVLSLACAAFAYARRPPTANNTLPLSKIVPQSLLANLSKNGKPQILTLDCAKIEINHPYDPSRTRNFYRLALVNPGPYTLCFEGYPAAAHDLREPGLIFPNDHIQYADQGTWSGSTLPASESGLTKLRIPPGHAGVYTMLFSYGSVRSGVAYQLEESGQVVETGMVWSDALVF